MNLQFAQSPQIQSKLNWKAIVFWGIALGLVGFVVSHFYREPIMAFLAQPKLDFSWIHNLTLDNILAFLKNYGVLISAAGVGITFVYGLYQKYQANKAALAVFQTQQNANVQINDAMVSAEQYRREAESYKTKYEALNKSGDLDAVAESQKLVMSQQAQIQRMQIEHNATVQTLQNEIDRLKIQVKEVTVVK